MAKEKKDVNYRAMSIEKAEEKAYAENYKMQLKKILRLNTLQAITQNH